MTDTQLHEHPAVLHLMGTEHWPTDTDENGQRCRLAWEVVDDAERSGWCFLRNENAILYEASERLAHSLITLAAVRAMWTKGYMVRQWEFPVGINTKACACYDYDHGHFFGPYGTIWLQPTEPLAILEAYRATVMEPAP